MNYLTYQIPRRPEPKPRRRARKHVTPVPRRRKAPPKVEGFYSDNPPPHVIRQCEYARIYSVPLTLVTLLIDLGFFTEDETLRDYKWTRWMVMKKSTSTKGRRLRDMLAGLDR